MCLVQATSSQSFKAPQKHSKNAGFMHQQNSNDRDPYEVSNFESHLNEGPGDNLESKREGLFEAEIPRGGRHAGRKGERKERKREGGRKRGIRTKERRKKKGTRIG